MNKSDSKKASVKTHSELISVVLPCFNERKNIEVVTKGIIKHLSKMSEDFEIIIVDDGSDDGTWPAIQQLADAGTSVIGLKLSRNFSHQSALIAGLSEAQGAAVITMDSDLQHPPEVIPDLLSKWRDGFKIVTTRRIEKSAPASPFKRISSKLFYRFFSFMTAVRIEEGASDFRLLGRQPLDVLLNFAHSDRFLRGSVTWMGFPTATVAYEVGERYSGRSKYDLKKMLQFATTAITSFSTRPLQVGIWLGILVGLLALMELVYVVVQALSGFTVPGWASTVGIISFLFAILFMVIGVMGLYIARIYSLLQRRPTFIITQRTDQTPATKETKHVGKSDQ